MGQFGSSKGYVGRTGLGNVHGSVKISKNDARINIYKALNLHLV